jgi:DUF1365 family protein
MSVSAIYDGAVVHIRHGLRGHRLRYRLIQFLFDLDELPGMDRRLRLLAFNRFGLFSFYESDHLAGNGEPLRGQVEALLAGASLEGGGAIRVLCLPRLLGYVFNPLSLFYCYRPSGELAAVVLEVHNTFGERHCYVLEAGAGPSVRSRWRKTFFVSPFLGQDMVYDASIAAPAQEVTTLIVGRQLGGAPLITASFVGRRRDLTDRTLAATLLRHPLATLKVIAAIHWEAVKLLAKGMRVHRRPTATGARPRKHCPRKQTPRRSA